VALSKGPWVSLGYCSIFNFSTGDPFNRLCFIYLLALMFLKTKITSAPADLELKLSLTFN